MSARTIISGFSKIQRDGWQTRPFWTVANRVKSTGWAGEELLSVYLGRGVIRHAEASDYTHAPSEDLSAYQLVEPGNLVMNNQQAFRGCIGVSSYRGITSPAYLVYRLSPDLLPRYAAYLFPDRLMVGQFGQVSRGVGTIQRQVSPDDLREIRVLVPPLADQRAIADYLDTETARIDALIAKKQRMIDVSSLRWRRQLLDVVAPHLGGDPVPEGWVLGRLRNLVDRVVGGSWGAEPGEAAVDAPCVRAADFNFPRLSAEGGAIRSYGLSEMQSRVVRPGDLVIEKSGGGDEAPVGRVVMWLGDNDGVPTNFAARLRPTDAYDPWFVLLAFRAAYEAGLNWRSIKQTTGIQNLDTGAYLSEPWPIPPIDVQRRVASELRARLESTMSLREILQRQIDLLREHRQALITAAVTGELNIPGVAA